MNIECELLWEHELFEGSDEMTVALKAVNICIDEELYDDKHGRYNKSGYLFQVDQPTNPETGKVSKVVAGTLEPSEPFPWITE